MQKPRAEVTSDSMYRGGTTFMKHHLTRYLRYEMVDLEIRRQPFGLDAHDAARDTGTKWPATGLHASKKTGAMD